MLIHQNQTTIPIRSSAATSVGLESKAGNGGKKESRFATGCGRLAKTKRTGGPGLSSSPVPPPERPAHHRPHPLDPSLQAAPPAPVGVDFYHRANLMPIGL